MRPKGGVVTLVVVGTVAAAVLATILMQDGWALWLPVLVAFAIAAKLWSTIAR